MTQQVRWTRLLAEGGVIVGSILLAFAVDAWWDGRRDDAETQEQLEAVAAELGGNIEILKQYLAGCERRLETARQFLGLMGPSPGPLAQDSLTVLLRGVLVGPPSALRTSALGLMAAGGRFASIQSPSLQRDLNAWTTDHMALRAQQSENVRTMQGNTSTHLRQRMPFLHITAGSTDGSRLPRSEFPVESADVLSDPVFEGLVGRLAQYRERICRFDQDRLSFAESLMERLDEEMGR